MDEYKCWAILMKRLYQAGIPGGEIIHLLKQIEKISCNMHDHKWIHELSDDLSKIAMIVDMVKREIAELEDHESTNIEKLRSSRKDLGYR